jgi:hypothetical protein
VLTVSATNILNVTGTITVIADDGAGGRATNTFTATTITETFTNEPPIIYPTTVTNRLGAVNARLTNSLAALDLDAGTNQWIFLYYDNNATNSFLTTNGPSRFVVVPNSNFVGSTSFQLVVSSDPSWVFFFQFFPPNQWPPYDWQKYTFAFGDTAIVAAGTNFVANPLATFTNQIVATFTNGVPGSAPGNFAATINWGDNVITAGVISSNLAGSKEVRGSHTYTNSGTYPVYVTIHSVIGLDATVVSTALVQPTLRLARAGTNSIVGWPAWASDFQLQSNTNLVSTNWVAITNLSALVGYDNVVTNGSAGSNGFYRLKR